MPILLKADSVQTASVSTAGQPLESLLAKQWLLTNGRGAYASSTVIGCNTSSYHGLLIGSLAPPADRVMALANCLEMIVFNDCQPSPEKLQNPNADKVLNLSTFEFDNKFTPKGFTVLRNFHRDIGVHFEYESERVALTKSVYLLRDEDTVVLHYDFKRLAHPAQFIIRPFVGLRDFHALQKPYAPLAAMPKNHGILVKLQAPASPGLFLSCPAAEFQKDEQWWFNFVYRDNAERGQQSTEDLWTPGFFRANIHSPTQITFAANLSRRCEHRRAIDIDIDAVRSNLRAHNAKLAPRSADKTFRTLCLAADQFVAKRGAEPDAPATILAGYPWFADWGRDAFISLPGLLLATKRFDEAKSVLATFSAAVDRGMIPSRFDDKTTDAHFNSVDASLWFINAAFQYFDATEDAKTFTQHLLPTIRWIIDSYRDGTRFGIHADADALIAAGNSETQLTWMDAKHGDRAFTPRDGKPVEINALWYNALCLLAQFYNHRNQQNAEQYNAMARQVAESFRRLFWNDQTRCLNDCILPDGSPDPTIRPNQIFAVSLPFSPLPPEKQKAVVDVVREYLLTPYGLRTLDPNDKRFEPACTGPPHQRDQAYHQGTVWPYLIGPFIEAYLKVNQFSKKSRKTAAQFIQPLLNHLTKDACLPSISEIFDGAPPHKPRGCFAQAWSVAELIRAYQLIHG